MTNDAVKMRHTVMTIAAPAATSRTCETDRPITPPTIPIARRTALQAPAESGQIDPEDFLACVRESLPYAYQTVAGLAGELGESGHEFVDNLVPPPD